MSDETPPLPASLQEPDTVLLPEEIEPKPAYVGNKPPPFPPIATDKGFYFIELPNVLKETGSHNGRDLLTIIHGGQQRVEITGEHWLSDEDVKPPDPGLFAPVLSKLISPMNQINAGIANAGLSLISVINDAVEYNGKKLLPTNPTASQYLGLVGKKAFISFKCVLIGPRVGAAIQAAAFLTYRDVTGTKGWKNADKPLYSIHQTWCILP